MSKAPAPAFALEGWSSNVSVARRPSWIYRKTVTSRPPAPTATQRARSMPPEMAEEPMAVLASLHPPPPSPVEIATSMALTQLADENAALRSEAAETAAATARMRRELLEASEDDLVRLALAIAERVVGRELAADPGLVVLWAREAIETLAAGDGVVIAMARDVASGVSAAAWDSVGVQHREVTDAQLPAGTVEVRAPQGIVVTGSAARLGAVARALGVAEEP